MYGTGRHLGDLTYTQISEALKASCDFGFVWAQLTESSGGGYARSFISFPLSSSGVVSVSSFSAFASCPTRKSSYGP